MSRLERLDAETWQPFLQAPQAVLMLSKTDCPACAAWTEELEAFLDGEERPYEHIRFGKLVLDQGGLGAFKKQHPWIGEVLDLPTTVIFVEGERHKMFAGGGTSRLQTRLDKLAARN